nr:MAG TPA: hypothetical protein [Caudoviricetes sp.]
MRGSTRDLIKKQKSRWNRLWMRRRLWQRLYTN